MRTARGSHVALALADGRVLVTGGHRARGEILTSAEIFDPGTGEFHPTGDMGVPRHKHAAVLLADGRVLIVGGSDARDYRGRYTTTEFYDPETGEFSPGPNMGWGRHKIRDAVAVLPSGAVLVAGGAAQPELFHPADRIFVPVKGELDGPQMFATATRLPTGQVLVLGGYDDRIKSSASAWLIGTTR
ncbi:MAG: Kelch repeat-containing protein [Candidatus Binatia bacterium]